MEKRLIILLFLFLCGGCHNNYRIACIYELDDKSLNLDIKAINDDISSIDVRACFEVPYKALLDKEKFDFINSQLDETYHFEDNILVREYSVELDKTYSLDKTIEYLNSKRFHCE